MTKKIHHLNIEPLPPTKQRRDTQTICPLPNPMSMTVPLVSYTFFQHLPSTDLSELTDQQKSVIDLALQGHSVFYTGPAGTGKSYVLDKLVQVLRSKAHKTVFVTASTGTLIYITLDIVLDILSALYKVTQESADSCVTLYSAERMSSTISNTILLY
jgi:hypothetical protein